MEDFKYCVWLSPPDGHPWNDFISNVPAHLTVASNIDSLQEAKTIFEGITGPISVRRSDSLEGSTKGSFHALATAIEVTTTAPSWFPSDAHVSFHYKYGQPPTNERKQECARGVDQVPKEAILQVARIVKATGHFSEWTTLEERTLDPWSLCM